MENPGSVLDVTLENVNRKLKYKELIELGTQINDDLENKDVLDTFNSILNIVNTCENISNTFVKDGKIENAADYLMDAQIIKMSYDLMGSTAEKMGSSDFSEDEFIAALTNMLTLDGGDHNLADLAVKCCKPSQFSVSLLGTFEFDAAPRPEKVVKERQRNRKSNDPTMAPVNVTQLQKSTKGAEKINVVRKEIQRICRERKTNDLPYFELVCHPTNFMKSIDTAFQISFLVRDGFLGLKKVEAEPVVYLYDPDPTQQSQRTQHASDTVQCVMSLNPKTWKEKIRTFKISKPLLQLEFDEVNGAGTDEMEVDSD